MEITLVVVVVGFALVQSVFGVGLLVFGTPTLLLLGYSFEETLAYLLPCSIAISVLQLAGSDGIRLDPLRRQFLIFTAPMVLVGTLFILTVGAGLDIGLMVAAVLIFSGVIRLVDPARAAFGRLARRFLSASLVFLGVLHGLTNLGGGVHTVIVGSVYDAKEDIRRQIAFGYGMMALIQLATLWMTATVDVAPALLVGLPLLAGGTYLLVGNRVFRAASQAGYQVSLTALIILFGLALVADV